jgi:glycosyltransferase involved in cell wall biosynthesis
VSLAFRVDPGSLTVIPNGATFAAPSTDRAAARAVVSERLGLPGNARIILTVARLGVQKAHSVLLEAIPPIVAQHPDAHFVWLGEGEQRAVLSARVAALGLTRHVHLPGFQHDIPDWLLATDLFAFPTHYEGLPFSLVEAMAAGLPVAASRVSSIPEILDNGESGVLVDNTAEAWTAAINALLADDALCETLGTHARLRAGDFTEAAMTRDTVALLEACAKGNA